MLIAVDCVTMGNRNSSKAKITDPDAPGTSGKDKQKAKASSQDPNKTSSAKVIYYHFEFGKLLVIMKASRFGAIEERKLVLDQSRFSIASE